MNPNLAPALPAAAASRRPLIATSLGPKKLERQQQAVASWQAQGFDVVSVNCREEIAQVQSHFPGVAFHTATRDARELSGKPLVALDSVLAVLRQEARPLSGIVNSDIVLCSADLQPMAETAHDLAGDGLVFIKRFDQTDESQLGRRYDGGIDAFFFGPRLLAAYPATPYFVGLPWWDYFFAAYPILAGLPCRSMSDRVALHLAHPSFYDIRRHWIPLGFETFSRLRPLFDNRRALVAGSGLAQASQLIDQTYTPRAGADLSDAQLEVLFTVFAKATVSLIDHGAAPHFEIREAFVLEPDWMVDDWLPAVLSFAVAFAPEEPVTLILASGINQPPDVSEAHVRARWRQVLAETRLTAFPDMILVFGPDELNQRTRGYQRVQWLTSRLRTGDPLRGARAARLLQAHDVITK